MTNWTTRLRNGLAPTLVRRVMAGVLLGWLLCWLALMLQMYGHRFDDEIAPLQHDLAQAGKVLDRITDQDAARAFGAALALVHGPRGRLVHIREKDDLRHPATLNGEAGGVSRQIIDGQAYQVVRRDGARWSLSLAAPAPSLLRLVRQSGLTMGLNMLIIFPCLMLPLWLAIRRGFAPLRQLARILAGRKPDDWSPLGFAAPWDELQPLVAALDALLLRLAGKIAREHAFVQDAAHELRTPLAVISAQAHVLAHAGAGGEQDDARNAIVHAMQRANHLLAQLCALADLHAGPAQACDCVALLHGLRFAMLPLAREQGMQIVLQLPPAATCEIDAQALESIVRNLLDNALRYGVAGGTVTLGLTAQGGHLVLRVADDGPGIAPEEQQRVFERFYRGRDNPVSGSGLGLAIVRQACVLVGASIALDSAIGQGCVFTVTVPVSPPVHATLAAAPRGGSVWRALSQVARPTLMRRLMLSILLACALLWLALSVQGAIWSTLRQPTAVAERLQAAMRVLDQLGSEREVMAFMQGYALRYPASGPHAMPLRLRLGQRVLFHQGDAAVAPGQASPSGPTLNWYRYQGQHGTLEMALPQIAVLARIRSDALDPDFNEGFLLVIPIQMLVLWLAVRRGLIPLRQLAQHVAQRKPDQLDPVAARGDYGELKPVVAALDSLLQRLRAKAMQEQAFVRDAAEALRRPLTQVARHLAALHGAQRIDAEQAIDQALAQASHLIQQLLELARLDGMAAPESQAQDVAQLLRQMLAHSVPRALQRGIELSLCAEPVIMHVIERHGFQTIVSNLLDNALRYGNDGGVVVLSLWHEAGTLHLCISDDGPGIDPARRDAVFARFCHGTATTDGAGLGLALVRQAAGRLGGTVTLTEGIGGKGCCFALCLPPGGAPAIPRIPPTKPPARWAGVVRRAMAASG